MDIRVAGSVRPVDRELSMPGIQNCSSPYLSEDHIGNGNESVFIIPVLPNALGQESCPVGPLRRIDGQDIRPAYRPWE